MQRRASRSSTTTTSREGVAGVQAPPRRPARRATPPPTGQAAPADASAPIGGNVARGNAARDRLLREATRAFADKGYAAASTREISEAAGTNVSAIAYYFGGKEGLYREVLLRPVRDIVRRMAALDAAPQPLREQLRALYRAFLEPMANGDEEIALHMRVHLREMVEPSSLLLRVFERDIAPHHNALVALLARHTGAAAPDADLHQLAFALIAMVNDYWMSQDCIRALAPGVLVGPQAVWRVIDRLADYAVALVEFEAARRRRAAAPSTSQERIG